MLKAIITADELKTLSASDQAHYTKREDGMLYLTVEGINGYKLENTEALNRALERERENVKAEKKALAELAAKLDGVDVEEAKALIARKKAGKPDSDLQSAIDSAIKSVTEKLNGQHEATKTVLTKRDAQLARVMIDSHVESAILAEDGVPLLLKPHVSQYCRMVENSNTGEYEVRVVDAKGEARMSMEPDNNGPMGIRELVKSMKKKPEFQPAFKGSGGTGSGRVPGNSANGLGGKKLSADPSSPDFNLTELAKLKLSDPAAYKQLMDEFAASR